MWFDGFFELNAHTKAGTNVHDASATFEDFLSAVQHNVYPLVLSNWIKCVDIAARRTDVARPGG